MRVLVRECEKERKRGGIGGKCEWGQGEQRVEGV